MNPFRAYLRWPAAILVKFDLVDRTRAHRIIDLSWPRMVTGFSRVSQEVADFAMIGMVLGPTALAGMAYAAAYWMIGNTLSLGLSGGTINQISREFGAGDHENIDLAVKQSLLVAAGMGAVIAAVYLTFGDALIGLLSDNDTVIGYGVTYLQVMSVGLTFEFGNKVLSRALIGADDAVTPMLVRGTGGLLNIFLNAVFIFGFGWGVFGAGAGTVVATLFVTVSFTLVLTTDVADRLGTVPFSIRIGPPYLDIARIRNLFSLSVPLMFRRLAQTVAVFPLLAMAGVYGAVIVAGYEVARRIRRLLSAPNWGFSLAVSSLFGQELGAGDRTSALAYGWDTVRLSLFVHVLTAVFVFVFARQIGSVIVNTVSELNRIVPLIRLAAVGVLGVGLDGVMTGIFRGSGNTRWTFSAKFAGLYFVTLPIIYVGTVTPLGINGLYIGIIAETTVSGVILAYVFVVYGP